MWFFNHFQFGNIALIFTEVRILFFNNVELENKVPFFTEGSMSFFTMCSKYGDNSRFANIFLFYSRSLVDCLLYVIAQKILSLL